MNRDSGAKNHVCFSIPQHLLKTQYIKIILRPKSICFYNLFCLLDGTVKSKLLEFWRFWSRQKFGFLFSLLDFTIVRDATVMERSITVRGLESYATIKSQYFWDIFSRKRAVVLKSFYLDLWRHLKSKYHIIFSWSIICVNVDVTTLL